MENKGDDKTKHFKMTPALGGQGIKLLDKEEIKGLKELMKNNPALKEKNYLYKIKFLIHGG